MTAPDKLQVLGAVRQLAMLVRLGYPLSEGLKSMASETSPWLGRLAQDMDRGDTLTQAMARQPRLFSPFFRQLIEAAQSSPHPEVALDDLSRWLERADAVDRRVQTILLYPVLVLVALLLYLALMAVEVWPQVITPLLEAVGRPSPSQQPTMLAVPLLLLALWLVVSASWGRLPQWLLGLMPGIGPIRLVAAQSIWARAVGSLVAAGVSPVEALERSLSTVELPGLRSHLAAAVERARRGSTLAAALADCPLEPHLLWALEAGTQTEDLASRLLFTADELESQIDHRAELALRLLGPRVLLAVGLLTGLGLALFWWPFYQLSGRIF